MKNALRILRLFCPPHLLEEIEGDLMQRYERDVQAVGKKRAIGRLRWNAIRYVRLEILLSRKRLRIKNTIMLKRYFKMAYHQLSSSIAFTTIDVIGLSLGLVIAMLILIYVRFELSSESQNPLAGRLIGISSDYLNGETAVDQDVEMYAPAAPRINSEFSEVVSFVRAAPLSEVTIRVGKETFRESKIYWVDSSFFSRPITALEEKLSASV